MGWNENIDILHHFSLIGLGWKYNNFQFICRKDTANNVFKYFCGSYDYEYEPPALARLFFNRPISRVWIFATRSYWEIPVYWKDLKIDYTIGKLEKLNKLNKLVD